MGSLLRGLYVAVLSGILIGCPQDDSALPFASFSVTTASAYVKERRTMKRRLAAIFCVAALCVCAEQGRSVLRPYDAIAQEAVVAPAENLVVEGGPAIPASLVETAGRYGSYRSATLADWSPSGREMLIATRFADTAQLHLVKMPGGERQQLTFFADAVSGGRFHPAPVNTFRQTLGDYIVFAQDVDGWEGYQLYRYDV